MLASITATSANNQQPPTQTILSFLKQYVQTDTEPKSAAEQGVYCRTQMPHAGVHMLSL